MMPLIAYNSLMSNSAANFATTRWSLVLAAGQKASPDSEEALATLSAQDRELIALRYGSDLSPREIAKLLDRRRNAIDVALSRARGRLAVALEAASSSGGNPKTQGEVVARLSGDV